MQVDWSLVDNSDIKQYFGNDDINYLDIIGYHIAKNLPEYPLKYWQINRDLRSVGLKIPPQYASMLRPKRTYPNLDFFVSYLKSASKNYMVYAYVCSMFFYTQAYLNSIKNIDELKNAPKWLRIILNRLEQKPELNKVFYVNRDDLEMLYSLIEDHFGFTLYEYIDYFNTYSGMKEPRIKVHGSNPDVSVEIRKRQSRNVRSCVTMFEFVNTKREIFGHGFCLEEIESGLYLVHGTNDICYIVPFYLLDMPHINVKYPPTPILEKLYELNYIPEEDQKQITTRSKLTQYKISLRRLK